MEQAHNTEELTSGQMTLEEARDAMCPRRSPEFYKSNTPGFRQPLGFRRASFQCSGRFPAWSG
jgi:hypothetical protein